jgi:zinc and cadmium transporter
MLAIIISSLVIMCASLIGVIFTFGAFKKYIDAHMGFLVSLSAGVFLVIVAQLILEAFEHSDSPVGPAIGILSGIVGVLLLFKLLPAFHHHHDEHHEHETHDHIDARKIVLSDAIHNIGDGVLLAASFAVSIPIGIAATASIFIHELIQEISEFFVLRQSGMSTQKALAINFLASSTILIGALGGFFLLDSFEALEIPLLAISAGAFLVVVVQDLIPESIRHSRTKKQYIKHILFFLIGALLMFAVSSFATHGH